MLENRDLKCGSNLPNEDKKDNIQLGLTDQASYTQRRVYFCKSQFVLGSHLKGTISESEVPTQRVYTFGEKRTRISFYKNH